MIEKVAALPRWVYGLVLVMSLLAGAVMVVNTAGLDALPIASVPFEYWLYLGLGLMLVVSLVVSLNYLFRPTRMLSSSMAWMGLFLGVNFLLRITSTPWTGNTIAIGIGTAVFFPIALLLRIEETREGKHASAEWS